MVFKDIQRLLAVSVIVCATQFYAGAQNLSSIEQAIVKRVEANGGESVRFLKTTVDVNSGTLNSKGNREVGKLYQSFLEDLGFATRWVDMPVGMNRGGHLIAEIKGDKGKRLMLIGHMDTVFEEDSPFQQWEQRGSIAYGPGVADMKGGNMVMLYSLKALKETGQLEGRQIVVVLHGDEENPGRPLDMSRRNIVELAKRSDIALAYEPSTGFEYGTVARRSSSGWSLKVEGVQAHSSNVFSQEVGSGAIFEAARILHRFHEELREEGLTYNPGLIIGGSEVALDSSGISGIAQGKTNLVPDMAFAVGDLRTVNNEQTERIRHKMKAIVAESHEHTQATISFTDGYPAMPLTGGNMALLEQYSQASEDLGLGKVGPYDPSLRGAGDISFVSDYVDCLDGLGVAGGGTHSLKEYVMLDSIEDITKRSALLLYRLSNQPK